VRLTDCMFFPIKKIIQIMGILLKKKSKLRSISFFFVHRKEYRTNLRLPMGNPEKQQEIHYYS
jgi:hypothetical protein